MKMYKASKKFFYSFFMVGILVFILQIGVKKSYGNLVTSDLWIKAVINTVEKGPIEAVWQKGGEDTTSRGDRVIWGYFYADPSDVTWGSENNPDLFVKIWFDVSGRIDVNYFHVSVPDIEVYSDYPYDGTADEHGTTTMSRRYIRQYYEGGQSYSDENYEDGNPPSGYSPAGNPSGYSTINNLRIGSMINTVEKGPIDAVWRLGGQDTTSRGDQVVWGHFYASSSDVTWGSQNNPDLFVKIWFDVSGRVDVNFFHVSVPDIEVCSDFSNDSNYDTRGTTIMDNRYIRHEYWGEPGTNSFTGGLSGTWEGGMFPGHYIIFEVEDINGENYITFARGSYVAIGCFNDQYIWESNDFHKIVNNECHIYFPDDINFGDGRGMELHIYFDSDTELHGTWVGETFCEPLIEGTLRAYHCIDKDNDGYDSCNECDDDNADIHPDADEICDGVDNDCDGEIDEGLFYPDVDQDGYGDATAVGQSCPVPEDYVKDNTDCDDSNFSINPGKEEISQNFLDDNCDGQIDEGFETISTISINSPGAIAISPNGDYLYVTNSSENSVLVIRTSDNTLIDTISVDGYPDSLSVTQDGQYLYVVYMKVSHSTTNNYMSVIRTSDNTIIDTISLGYHVGSGGITVLPNGDYVYMTRDDSVSVFRTLDNTIIDTISVGASNIITTPNGDYVYVSNFSSSSISVIRTSDNTVINTIPIGSNPRGMAVTQTGDYIYVTNGDVSVIRTSDNTVIDTISVGVDPWGITVSPDGKYVYVVNHGTVTYTPGDPSGNTERWSGCSVSVVLTSNNTVLHNIPMGNGPNNIAITPSGDYVYVTVPREDLITVIGFPD
jgi:YVTN family beta-propeller protein